MVRGPAGALALVLTVVACSSSGLDAPASDAGSPPPAPRSFDPLIWPRACTVSADCFLVSPTVVQGDVCDSCCAEDVAIEASDEALAAYEAVRAQCRTLRRCAVACRNTAICRKGYCEVTRR